MSDKEEESACERFSFNFILKKNNIYSNLYYIRVVDIDAQRRQISIRRPTGGSNQRSSNTGDDGHIFFFDAVYDWKYVRII